MADGFWARFTVDVEQLAHAAPVIGAAADDAKEALDGLRAAATSVDAFGSEPIGQAFTEMCGRASYAFNEINDTTWALGQNVAAAGLGYLHTDHGVVPIEILGNRV